MADLSILQQRAMLRSYEQQLLAARRLARFRVRRRLAQGEEPYDPDPAIKRRAYVEQVAQELYDSLIFTGSDNPMVEEIRQTLSQAVGMEVEFTYPPGEKLCIVARGPNGPRPLTDEEQRRTRNALWRITRQKVDQSMLVKPSGLRA
ncbi:MAG: DVU0524 family FlgM-associated protein [Desulfovibrionaceae bacterium]|nr:DVU0524 family FlgM-associated protein [Desulfovibrionaceae bacterium]